MKLLLYSIFFLVLAPCNAPKNAAQSQTDNKVRTAVFTLQRTACFGKCPVFELTVSGADNKAIYKGTANTEKIGTYEKSISDEEIGKLMDAFDNAHFFEMKDEYNAAITDVPSAYISYSLNGKTKKIKDRWQPPAELKALEKLLDNVADSGDWKKVGE